MILVLAGTADGRELARAIQGEGYPVLLSTATAYGEDLAAGTPARSGVLDEEGLYRLLIGKQVKVLVDASHPFAANVSQNAMSACARSVVPYVRFERPDVTVPENPLVFKVNSCEEAVTTAGELGECIFLTIGSNNLSLFAKSEAMQGKRLIARVLPTPEVIAKCLGLGLKPGDIAAMQGPFGAELNKAMLNHYGAQVLVSKESGVQGGADAKLEAALELGIPIVLIQRPRIDYPRVVKDWPGLRALLKKTLPFVEKSDSKGECPQMSHPNELDESDIVESGTNENRPQMAQNESY